MAILELQPFDIHTASPGQIMSLTPFWIQVSRLGMKSIRFLLVTDTVDRQDALAGFDRVAVPRQQLPSAMRLYNNFYQSYLEETVQLTRYLRIFLLADGQVETETLQRLLFGYGHEARPISGGIPLPFTSAELQWDVAVDGAGMRWAGVQSREAQNGILYPQTLHRLFTLDFPLWLALDISNYDTGQAMSLMRQKKEAARATWADRNASQDEQSAATALNVALESFESEMQQSGAALHEMRLSIIVGGRSERELSKRLNIVRGASGIDLRGYRMPAKQLPELFAGKPSPVRNGVLMSSFGAALLTASTLSYKRPTKMDGVLLGFDGNQAPIVANIFDRANRAYNITVIGQTGAGKTFFMLLLMLRQLLLGVRLIIIDPKGDIDLTFLGQDADGRELCQVVRAGTAAAAINILSITYDEIATQVQFAASLLQMLGVYARQETMASAVLDDALMGLYRPFWVSGRWQTGLSEDDMPTLARLQQELIRIAESEQDAEIASAATTLAYKLNPYVSGSRTALFGRPTSIDVSLDAPVTIFDVSAFPSRQTGGNLRTALSATLFALINQSIVKRRRRGDHVPIQFMIDEIGVQMRDPIIADYTSDKFKTARSLDVSMMVADQTIGSLVGTSDESGIQHGNEMLANSPFRFVFYQPDSEAPKLERYFPTLPDGYRQQIHQFGLGTCLAQTPQGITLLNVVPSDFERIVLSSRSEDRQRARSLIEQMRQE